jgi:virginiamycin B lyase
MYSTSTIPTANSYPTSIAAGSDGNLWFVELNNGKVAKLTTSRVFTEYTPPSGYGPAYLAAGPDSAIWFINGGKVGSISSSGVFTGYTIPGTSLSGFNGLTLGPDNAMWFSYKDSVGPKLGRLGY